jgi:signal peptidase II
VSPRRTTLAALAVAAGVLIADQLAKAIVRDRIGPGDRVDVLGPLDFVHVRNSGVAFGFLSGGGALVVAGVAAALIALLAFFATHARRPLIWLPTGLLVGGALGNLIDRASHGSVTDFVKFPHWPAFNVADIAITCGVVALILVIERRG